MYYVWPVTNLYNRISLENLWIKHMTQLNHKILTSMQWKHIESWLQRHGHKRRLRESLWGVKRETGHAKQVGLFGGDLLATGCLLAQPWLCPMQLSLITSSQQAHCDDAIPLEAHSGYPGRLSSHQNYISLLFSWCWLRFNKSVIQLLVFPYRVDVEEGCS